MNPLIRMAAVMLLTLSGWGVHAFPDRPVVLVVPFTASSGSDIISRIVAPKLSERWKQPVIVDNKPGASGNLGAAWVAQAPADGHTLLMAINTLTMTPAVYKNMPYDAATDFAPVLKMAAMFLPAKCVACVRLRCLMRACWPLLRRASLMNIQPLCAKSLKAPLCSPARQKRRRLPARAIWLRLSWPLAKRASARCSVTKAWAK